MLTRIRNHLKDTSKASPESMMSIWMTKKNKFKVHLSVDIVLVQREIRNKMLVNKMKSTAILSLQRKVTLK